MNPALHKTDIERQFDWQRVRAEFPVLASQMNGRPLVYLDSAASAQKPRAVIDCMSEVLGRSYANVHRGVYALSSRLTSRYEDARARIASFIGAAPDEIVITRGATESINLVAQSWGVANLRAGDEVILSVLEHHANIVPWQMLRERLGIVLKVIPCFDTGELDIDAYERLLSERTKLVALTHMSNALGVVPPVKKMIAMAHERHALALLDSCQAIAHLPVNVEALGADFLVFSGHKLYGPTGVGVLYAKRAILADMPPWQTGGDMVETVSFDAPLFKPPPYLFEAGTPPIAETIALGSAIDWLDAYAADGFAYEDRLLSYAKARLAELPGVRVIGSARPKSAIMSLVFDGIHPQDVGILLDHYGIAVRTGFHCAAPALERFGLSAGGSVRVSLGIYNSTSDIDALIEALVKVREILG
ncbi:MAG: SufS family cysteine desulfurase [Pseudomonadota bacterium]|nr:SufS family cysteine desulfurase [Pseudomonadota bacterium]